MAPLALAAIMAGGGLLKSELIDRPKSRKQYELAANTQRYSPWTGLRAQTPEDPDAFGAAMQGGVQGYALGQNIQSADDMKNMQKAQLDLIRSQKDALNRGVQPPTPWSGIYPWSTY